MTLSFKSKRKRRKVYIKKTRRRKNKYSNKKRVKKRVIRMSKKKIKGAGPKRAPGGPGGPGGPGEPDVKKVLTVEAAAAVKKVEAAAAVKKVEAAKRKVEAASRKVDEAARVEAAAADKTRSQAVARDDRLAARERERAAAAEVAAIAEIEAVEASIELAVAEAELKALQNTQHRVISSSADVNGPDYQDLPRFQEFETYVAGLPEGSEKGRGDEIIAEIERRAGSVRSSEGQYTFSELPRSNAIPFGIEFGRLVKLVIVKREAEDRYIILRGNANMVHTNYAEDFFKKWVDFIDGKFIMRREEKIVIPITREIIAEIEGRLKGTGRLTNNNLLLTKSYNPGKYDIIIKEYLASKYPENINNITDISSMYEIPHSAIANNYRGVPLQMSGEAIPRPLIYAGLEGVFYQDPETESLCFIICNLSGHYKTPKDRMEFVKDILETYGYTDINILNPTPQSSQSSQSSDSDSDSGSREDYRRIATNCSNITTFEEAISILNRANQTPIVGPQAQSFSQQENNPFASTGVKDETDI